jgi:hypothetical protein
VLLLVPLPRFSVELVGFICLDLVNVRFLWMGCLDDLACLSLVPLCGMAVPSIVSRNLGCSAVDSISVLAFLAFPWLDPHLIPAVTLSWTLRVVSILSLSYLPCCVWISPLASIQGCDSDSACTATVYVAVIGTAGTVYQLQPVLDLSVGFGGSFVQAAHAAALPERSLSVTDPVVTALVSGLPVNGSTSSGYVYYSATITTTAAVTLTLTPVAGDPDMYVNTNANNLPTSNNRNWLSNGLGQETISLQSSDYLPLCPGRTVPCTLYIGVTGFAGTAVFSILFTAGGSQLVTLIDGRPQVRFIVRVLHFAVLCFCPSPRWSVPLCPNRSLRSSPAQCSTTCSTTRAKCRRRWTWTLRCTPSTDLCSSTWPTQSLLTVARFSHSWRVPLLVFLVRTSYPSLLRCLFLSFPFHPQCRRVAT